MKHKSSAPRGAHSKGRTGEGSASASARGYTPSGSRRDRASEEPKQPNKPEKKPSRRGAKKRGMLMGIIIAIAVLIVLALVLILTLGQRAPTHMLPKVTPPETAADVSTGAGT